MTWAVGVFRNLTNGFVYNLGSDDWAVSGRLTALPIYENDGEYLLHMGISGRHAGVNNNNITYRVRGPERAGPSTLWPRYANITNITANNQDNLNLELVSVLGPLAFQAEYDFNFLNDASHGGPNVGTLYYNGGYIEATYFLTGEHLRYIKKTALFDRVVPRENAFCKDTVRGTYFGTGAWQTAIRYNYLDLNNKGINGGVLNDVTMGLNLFINANTKVQWNYSVTSRQAPDGSGTDVIQGLGMRIAHDF